MRTVISAIFNKLAPNSKVFSKAKEAKQAKQQEEEATTTTKATESKYVKYAYGNYAYLLLSSLRVVGAEQEEGPVVMSVTGLHGLVRLQLHLRNCRSLRNYYFARSNSLRRPRHILSSNTLRDPLQRTEACVPFLLALKTF